MRMLSEHNLTNLGTEDAILKLHDISSLDSILLTYGHALGLVPQSP